MAETRAPAPPIGAYGFRLDGVDSAASFLQEAPGSWPRLEVRRVAGEPQHDRDSYSEERAVVVLQNGGEVVLEREPARAVFTVPREVTDDEIVHPYLAPAAAVFSSWLGRESLHAGAFVANGGAWALAGERQSGKSSTLAALAVQGHGVVCDDVLALADLSAFAGPRSLDLRAEAAEHLGVGVGLGVVGARERWRLALAPVPPEVPLRGVVVLEWGDELELERVSPRDRVGLLGRSRALRVPVNPGVLLRLAAVPVWVLRRPPGWASLESSLPLLLELA